LSAILDYLLLGSALIESPLLGAADAAAYRGDVNGLVTGLVGTLFVAVVAWMRVNINQISVHALYRSRLIHAYLGASNPERVSNPFTGFDEHDNCRMSELWTARKDSWQPFHVVNMSLNVMARNGLAWQERTTEPFTVTPLHSGSATPSLGYRRTKDYASRDGGLTLGTALAISGAPAGPNTGYHSSPIVNLLLALFSRRLGWWLGNPGPPGEKTYQTEGPNVAIVPYLFEVFGQATEMRRYVYLSDGGHVDNLGLYEMVRRRCRCILVSDASYDPDCTYGDLGDAVRKIEIDLGIRIRFDRLGRKRSLKKEEIQYPDFAVGIIDYKNSVGGDGTEDDGYIIYVRPSYLGTESIGVVAYAETHADFPHQVTRGRVLSEGQFESYRKLGFETMERVLAEASVRALGKAPTIAELAQALHSP
jgi:hypothetical protein